jgi:hypothetical protein
MTISPLTINGTEICSKIADSGIRNLSTEELRWVTSKSRKCDIWDPQIHAAFRAYCYREQV